MDVSLEAGGKGKKMDRNFNQSKRFGGINQRPDANRIPSQQPAQSHIPTGNVRPAVKSMGGAAPVRPTPSQQTATAQAPAQSSIAMDDVARDAMADFVSVMKEMVGGFALLSDEVINNNLKMAAGNGMSIDDRTISFECAQYVMSNFAYICMGLVFDVNFRDSFVQSLSLELNIDSLPTSEKEQLRASMKDNQPYKSDGSIVLGLTTFTPMVEKDLMDKMMAGFAKLDPYADEFDNQVANLTQQDKVNLGFIFSNFMFLIRAFTHNDMFMGYVVTVIERVKETVAQG